MNRIIIKVKNVSYYYPNSVQPALENVSVGIPTGSWTSVVGQNGSGKSTLVKLIDGLLPLKTGQIYVDGELLCPSNLSRIRSKVGLIFQDPKDQFVFPVVKDDLAFGLENRCIPRSKIDRVVNVSLSWVGMLKYKNTLIDKLSGGQQQRLALAEVIALRPKVMILDESVSMLDPRSRRLTLELVDKLRRRFRLTVIMITHGIAELSYSNYLILLNRGRVLASGLPKSILNDTGLLEQAGLPGLPVNRLVKLMRERGINVPSGIHSEGRLLKWVKRFH